MKRFLILTLGLTFAAASSSMAIASKSVEFNNQKVGQFCKKAEAKKTVTLPDESKIVCKKDGSRYRWVVYVEPIKTVPYKNQRVGQFCKVAELKKRVKLPDGSLLVCTEDGSRARWKEEEFIE